MSTNKKQVSRRDFLKHAAFGSASLVLAACGAPNTPASSSSTAAPADPGPVATAAGAGAEPAAAERTQLDVWTGWTEDAAKNIEKILTRYNESQTSVMAKHVVVPEAMNQKLLAAVAAGNPPGTAVIFGAGTAYQLAAQNAILPLDQLGEAGQVGTLKEWMAPALWDLGVYDGKFIFASMWNQCWGIFLNTTMAEEAGVDPNTPAKTLDELDAVWDKLTIYDNSGNISVLGGDVTWSSLVMGRFLGQYVDADGKTITANHPNNVKALEWVTNRWNRIGVQKMQDFYASLQGRGERSAGQDPFLSGLIASSVTGPWQFNTLRDYKPDDFQFTVWPFPSPTGESKRGMYTYGDGWIIPKGASDPEADWEIISSLTGATGDRDVYTSLFTTWLCVNGPVSEQMTTHASFEQEVMGACPGYEQVFLDDLFKSDYYLYPPKIPTSDSYGSLMSAEWEKVRPGEKQPKEALDFVTGTAQKELDDWLAQQGA